MRNRGDTAVKEEELILGNPVCPWQLLAEPLRARQGEPSHSLWVWGACSCPSFPCSLIATLRGGALRLCHPPCVASGYPWARPGCAPEWAYMPGVEGDQAPYTSLGTEARLQRGREGCPRHARGTV